MNHLRVKLACKNIMMNLFNESFGEGRCILSLIHRVEVYIQEGAVIDAIWRRRFTNKGFPL